MKNIYLAGVVVILLLILYYVVFPLIAFALGWLIKILLVGAGICLALWLIYKHVTSGDKTNKLGI